MKKTKNAQLEGAKAPINPEVVAKPKSVEVADYVTVTCTSGNVYLGDGRKLLAGESAIVSDEIAADLKKTKNVKIG